MDITIRNGACYEALDLIPPFDLLNFDEREQLVARAQLSRYTPGQVIGGAAANVDALFLLLEGRVECQSIDGDCHEKESIEAPGYFGERAVFFHELFEACYRAGSAATCWAIPGEVLRALTTTNAAFKRGFAAAFRDKHHLFAEFEGFLEQLLAQADQGVIVLPELLKVYKRLNPILHEKCNSDEMDLGALAFVMPRLAENITSTFVLMLTEEFPQAFRACEEQMRVPSRKEVKRRAYQLVPGKTLVVLRDRNTDTVDVVSKLCIYVVETAKIRARLLATPLVPRLSRLALVGATPEEAADLEASLPFPPGTVTLLRKQLGEPFLHRLYEIVHQGSDLSIRVEKTGRRYFKTASEAWLARLRHALGEIVSPPELNELDVHIISSNTHSVNNCLSTWLHRRADSILSAAEPSVNLVKPADQVYATFPYWAKAHPEQASERTRADAEQGIYVLQDNYATGIQVSLIDANRLSYPLDPDLAAPSLMQRTLVVNIDYAYGQQAEVILRSLILLFGRRIRSISILGKAGGVVGQRGDLLLPSQLLLQTQDEPLVIPNRDLIAADLTEVGCERAIHEGTLLTVLGTVMQSREMLEYYRHFWNAIGMEMEGAFYLREILRAYTLRLVRENTPLRFAYYVSDTPLESDASLAYGLSAEEGIPPLYAVTRAILRRILCAEASGPAELSQMARQYRRFKQ